MKNGGEQSWATWTGETTPGKEYQELLVPSSLSLKPSSLPNLRLLQFLQC